jgi:hypothetical protein
MVSDPAPPRAVGLVAPLSLKGSRHSLHTRSPARYRGRNSDRIALSTKPASRYAIATGIGRRSSTQATSRAAVRG